jgi:hypothetical protein
MMFFKLEFLIFKKGTHIYDLYYHRNNILKKKSHMFIFWFREDFKTCVLNSAIIFI